MKIIDLSLPLYSGMPVYPGDPQASITLVQRIERNGWDLRRLEINAHDGTHVNVPSHMVADGRTLDDYALADFSGPARLYEPARPMTETEGVVFATCNIDAAIAGKLKAIRPKFVGLSCRFDFDVEIERSLLGAGIICFERLANLKQLPSAFRFFGMPLKIRGGEASPVRAFALIEDDAA
jgi:kynurenine formamidase